MIDQSLLSSRTIRYLLFGLAFLLILLTTAWFWKRPISGHGGLPIPGKIEIPVPPFLQADPRWANDSLAGTPETLGNAGCAVTSAAMVLAYYGVPVDPSSLNKYLIENNGYEGSSWLKWEIAGTFPPNIAEKRYEDLPSYGLIDCNLLLGNPVIIRIRRSTGKTHFVVIVGKKGWDYLIRDPGEQGMKGVYPFYKLGTPIEALRYYSRHE
ncbi:MAG: C39 family peptidase [Chthoniobacterales bacterium]